MSRAAVSRLGVLVGGWTAAVGAGMALGLAAGVVAGGLCFAAWCLFLTDVDPAEGGKEGRP